jgi:hypothetical protein
MAPQCIAYKGVTALHFKAVRKPNIEQARNLRP